MMTNIEKKPEAQDQINTIEDQAKNLSPDQKNIVGSTVDKEKAGLAWRESGAYKILPSSYADFIKDLKTVDYANEHKYIANIKAYILTTEKVSLTLDDLRNATDGIIVKNNKAIALQNIYKELSDQAIIAYRQSNTGGIASADTLPEKVTLGDMKLLDHINTIITNQEYKDMMQTIQRCKDDDFFIKSDHIANPTIFYTELKEQLILDMQNPGNVFPIHQLFNTLLYNNLMIGKVDAGRYKETTNTYVVPLIDNTSFMAVEQLTWHNISLDMQKYMKPILESLFPYHTYNVDAKGTVRMIVYPSEIFKKLKADRDLRYKNRIESTGVGAARLPKVLENNFDLLSTKKREILSLCLSNIRQVPTEVFDIQEKYNAKILTEMSIDTKMISDPFGSLLSDRIEDISTIYTADQIKNRQEGDASSNPIVKGLYNTIQESEKYGKLIRFEPSKGGYKLVVYSTGYSNDGKAREVNFLNRWNNAIASF